MINGNDDNEDASASHLLLPNAVPIVKEFVMQYNNSDYQEALNRLHQAFGASNFQTVDDWSKHVYETLRDDPSHHDYKALNYDRKCCLELLYNLVRAWEAHGDYSVEFEQAIVQHFKIMRLCRILVICLPMDRAQALYKMQHGTNQKVYGMPWFCRLHIDENSGDTLYAQLFPAEHAEWIELSKPFLKDITFRPPMNHRLFRVIFSNVTKLYKDPDLCKWARPTMAGHDDHDPTTTTQSEIHLAIQEFVTRYDEPAFQEALQRLDQDRGFQDTEEWARDIYTTYLKDPFDERVKQLNMDRKFCLELLYDMARKWGDEYQCNTAYEQGIDSIFKKHRLATILLICLPMDRAQCLYKMRHGTDKTIPAGLPWYSKLHLEPDSVYAKENPAEYEQWMAYTQTHSLMQDVTFRPLMNHKLFRLLYSQRLNLRSNAYLDRWARPCKWEDRDLNLSRAALLSASAIPRASSTASSDSAARTGRPNKEEMKARVECFVRRYQEREYQDALMRLDQDRGVKDVEDWAEEVYTTLRVDPFDERCTRLNDDRRFCLRLLYDLVNEWEDFGLCDDYEMAIYKVFRVFRLVAILTLCLPMDRAQALYRLRYGSCSSYGMPWCSELHLQPDTLYAIDYPMERQKWLEYIAPFLKDPAYSPPMNRRLFILLFNKRFGLQGNAGFKKWSLPTKADHNAPPTEKLISKEDELAAFLLVNDELPPGIHRTDVRLVGSLPEESADPGGISLESMAMEMLRSFSEEEERASRSCLTVRQSGSLNLRHVPDIVSEEHQDENSNGNGAQATFPTSQKLWTCTSCNYKENGPRDWACVGCRADKHEEHMKSAVAVSAPASVLAARVIQSDSTVQHRLVAENMWTCTECSYAYNSAAKMECVDCGSKKFEVHTRSALAISPRWWHWHRHASAATSKDKKDSDRDNDEYWTCPKCQCENNPASSWVCMSCGSKHNIEPYMRSAELMDRGLAVAPARRPWLSIGRKKSTPDSSKTSKALADRQY